MAIQERDIVSYNVTITGGATTIPIWSANTIYTKSFDMRDGVDWACSTKFTNAASASCSVTVVLEQGWSLPAVEGSASATWVTTSAVLISTAVINTWRHHDLTTMPLPFGRFVVNGTLLNTASTVDIKIHEQVGG